MYWPQHGQVAGPAVGWQQPAPQYTWGQTGQLPAYGQYQAAAPAGFYTTAAASPAGFYTTAAAQPAAPVDPVQSFIDELGILPEEDAYFGWLAEYALQGDVLPPEWSIHSDESTGRFYYVDGVTGTSSWENPLTSCLQTMIGLGRIYLQAPTDDFFAVQKEALGDKHEQQLAYWHGPFADDSGRNYFHNSATNESSFRDPRAETQFFYELEGSLLDALPDALPLPGPDELPVFGLPNRPLPGNSAPHSPKSPASPASPGKAWTETAAVSTHEHKHAYDKMVKSEEHVNYLRKDQEEAQQLLIARKVRERRKRCERLRQAQERAKRDEEARSRGYADAEDEKQSLLRQKSLAEQEAIRKREEEEAEAERKRIEAEEEEARQEEERRKQAEEELRKREEEAARKEAERKESERKREEARQKAAAEAEAARLAKEAKEKFLSDLPEVLKSRDVAALNKALTDGEAFGFVDELVPVHQTLQELLQHRKAVALKARKAAEELAAQFSNAKEAQDFGGAILAAQWRAATREVAKPMEE